MRPSKCCRGLTCLAAQSRCLPCLARHGDVNETLEKKMGVIPFSPSPSRCFLCRMGLDEAFELILGSHLPCCPVALPSLLG